MIFRHNSGSVYRQHFHFVSYFSANRVRFYYLCSIVIYTYILFLTSWTWRRGWVSFHFILVCFLSCGFYSTRYIQISVNYWARFCGLGDEICSLTYKAIPWKCLCLKRMSGHIEHNLNTRYFKSNTTVLLTNTSFVMLLEIRPLFRSFRTC